MDGFFRLWIVSLIIKLGLAAGLPFFSDEAYYWVWSHDLHLSYYDHPPAVAWLFWLGHLFENLGQASRWAAVVVGHLTILIWHKILSPYINSQRLQVWLWLVLLNPLLGPGSLIITPDVPLMFFWTAALWSTLRLIKNPVTSNFALFGALMGLGICSKYHMGLFLPIAMYAFGSKLFPIYKKPLQIILAILVGLLFSAPVWIWNYQHDWASIQYQLRHGLGGETWRPDWTLAYIGGQVALLFPTLMYLLFRHRKSLTTPPWLTRFGWTPLLFFLLTSFKGRVEANWTLVGYPALLAIVAALWDRGPRLIKGTLFFWGTTVLLAISLVIHNWLPIEPGKLKTSEHRSYDVLAAVARSYKPFYASSYQMASTLTYQLKQNIYKLRGIGRRDYYDFIPESVPTDPVIFVALDRWDKIPDSLTEYSLSQTIDIDGRFRLLELKKK